MTNVKTEKKDTPAESKKTIKQEDLQVAYEIHTLAQLIYGQMPVANPWMNPVPPMTGLQPPTQWMPSMPEGVMPTWPTPSTWPW